MTSYSTLSTLRSLSGLLDLLVQQDTGGQAVRQTIDDLGQQLNDLVEGCGGPERLNDLEAHLVERAARSIGAMARQHPSTGRSLRSR